MTDIVGMLRELAGFIRGEHSVHRDAHLEAAAEIERLTATINGMVEKGLDDLTMVAAFQVNEELRAEIARLRALSQNNAHSWDAIVKERNDLRVENAELRKTNDTWVALHGPPAALKDTTP